MTNEKKEGSFNDSISEGLLKQRIIWLDSEVNSESANRISKQLMLLAADNPKRDITLYINSPGGSITDGMAVYDVMQLIEPDVVTIGIGMAASMGQFLLSSGAKGKRFITPNARVLMHQPSGGVGGTATDVRIGAELILDMKQRLSKLTAEQTGQPLEKILEDNEHDKWFTAEEALEYGFVDHIVQGVDIASKGGE
jgi:ATP-dependent Clp protease protease subunit